MYAVTLRNKLMAAFKDFNIILPPQRKQFADNLNKSRQMLKFSITGDCHDIDTRMSGLLTELQFVEFKKNKWIGAHDTAVSCRHYKKISQYEVTCIGNAPEILQEIDLDE